MSEQLQHDLITARFHYLASNLDDFIARATKSKLGPMEVINEIVRLEVQDRKSRTTERRLAASKVGRVKPMSEFDWLWPREIDRPAVERALALEFVNDDANVILIGPQGIAKTMIAKNIAHNAVMAGHTALCVTAAQLTNDLNQQESMRSLENRLRHYIRPDVLVVDEVGYLSFDSRSADLLFQIISRRYEVGPIVMTTNLAFKDWPTIFPGSACVAAMIDRLTHHAEIISIEGDSYRRRESMARKETANVAKKPAAKGVKK
jgi:DNA replication protein DnaC